MLLWYNLVEMERSIKCQSGAIRWARMVGVVATSTEVSLEVIGDFKVGCAF